MKNNIDGVIRVLAGSALLLIVPFLGAIFIEGWNWGAEDFVFAYIMFAGAGLIYELFIRRVQNALYRTVFTVMLVLCFLFIWAQMAVGIF